MERLSGIVEKDVAGRLAGCRDAGGLAGTMQDLQGSLIQKEHGWFFGSGASRSRAGSTVVDTGAWAGDSVGGACWDGVGTGDSGRFNSGDHSDNVAEWSDAGGEPTG
jgi:hypothetical protein